MKNRELWVTVFVLGAIGLALFIFLLVRNNLAGVGHTFHQAGWGVALVVLSHGIVFLTNVYAWRILFPPEHRLNLFTTYWIRWIGESVQNLLPATAVGGEIVRARIVSLR